MVCSIFFLMRCDFSLELEIIEIYDNLIKILEESDDLIQNAMAKKIGESGSAYILLVRIVSSR